MSRRARAFYQSPLTPLSFGLTGLFCAWGLSPFGPSKWKDVPSLQLLRHALPFPVMALGFLIYVVLLASQKIRAVIVADFMGIVIYLSEFAALIWTAHGTGVTNPILAASAFLAIILHALALRLAIFDKILV